MTGAPDFNAMLRALLLTFSIIRPHEMTKLSLHLKCICRGKTPHDSEQRQISSFMPHSIMPGRPIGISAPLL